MTSLDEIEILTFDCYGTLIDWESGLRQLLGELAADHGLKVSTDQLLREWETIQFRMIAEPWRPYRVILEESLRETFFHRGTDLSSEESGLLGARIGNWPPFPEVPETLAQLRRRYELAILSNIDDDILRQSAAQLLVPFDELITAEQVRSYKPRPAHFEEALRRFRRKPQYFLHSAFGSKDHAPALALGMATVWVKRPGSIRDDVAEPTYEVDSLEGLLELLDVI